MKRVLPALLVPVSLLAGAFLVRGSQARDRIASARAETAGLPDGFVPARDIGYELRRAPFREYPPPPGNPASALLDRLGRIRAREGPGLGGALDRLTEESRFLGTLRSMRRRDEIPETDVQRIRSALAARPPRPSIRDAYEVERLLLIREILHPSAKRAGWMPTSEDPPGARDAWSSELLLARALGDLDALYADILQAVGSPNPAVVPASDSPLAPWIIEVALSVLALDAKIQAEFDALLAETPP